MNLDGEGGWGEGEGELRPHGRALFAFDYHAFSLADTCAQYFSLRSANLRETPRIT